MIHSNVRLLMKIKNKKIMELAEEAKLDEFTIKKARDHKAIYSCRLSSLYTLAKSLNVDLEDLFTIKK